MCNYSRNADLYTGRMPGFTILTRVGGDPILLHRTHVLNLKGIILGYFLQFVLSLLNTVFNCIKMF